MVERRVVQYDSIKFIAFQKAADVSEERAAAHGSQIKCALERQRLHVLIIQPPAKLGCLNGAQHTLMAAAGHISCKADTQAVIKEFVDRRNTGSQVHIRFRRVCDKHTVLFHQRLLILIRVDAVRHDARISAAKETELFVCIAVMLRARTQFPNPRDLRVILRQVALYRHTVLCLQPRQSVHEIVCTRWNKARRQDGLHIPVRLFCLAEPAFRVAQRLIG